MNVPSQLSLVFYASLQPSCRSLEDSLLVQIRQAEVLPIDSRWFLDCRHGCIHSLDFARDEII